MDANFRKRKIQEAATGNFVQKWLFCKTYVVYNMFCSLSVTKILDKYVRSKGKLTFTWKIYWTAISITVPLSQIFWTEGERKINKIYQQKLSLRNRLCVLLIHIIEKFRLINSEVSVRRPRHLNRSLLRQ